MAGFRAVPIAHPNAWQILMRILLAVAGGYVFVRALAAFGIVGLVALGVAYDTAWMAVMMLAFLLYLAAFLWAFATRRPIRMTAVLLGGAWLAASAAQWLMARAVQGS